MSLSEIVNKEEVQNIAKKISSNKIKVYDTYIDRYRDCPGSLYWLACALMTSEYDDHYSKSRNNKAFKLFKSLAPHGDPRVCKELADYFLFIKSDIEESLKWRKKSIDNGNLQDLREYADSIIDDAPTHIHDALAALHQMQELNINPGWAYWKEGFIYMKGLGVEKDLKKGFHLTEKGHLLGHPVAKSDLAFFYYQGMGTEKDLHKALELLEEANKISREKNARLKADSEDQEDVQGDYESQIAFIKTELKKDLR
jgi:TPR repeat protein